MSASYAPVLVGLSVLVAILAACTAAALLRSRMDRRYRARSTAILESITDGFFAVDREWRFTYVNREAERLLRRARRELLGRNLWEEFPEAVGSTFHREYHRALAEGVAVHFEEFYPPLEIWVEVRAFSAAAGLSVYFRDVTARRRTEEALRESEERYRSLFERIPLGLYRTSPEGDILDANPALVEMLGYPDLEGLRAAGARAPYVNDDDRARWEALLERDGVVHAFEMQDRRPDGTVLWVHDSARAVRDANGRTLYYEGVLEDVTPRKRAEERLRALLESSSEIINIVDPGGALQYVSPSMERVLGYAVEDVVGRNAFDLLHRDDVPAAREALAAVLRDPGKSETLEVRTRHVDGSWRIFESLVRNLLHDTAVGGVVVNSRDVTLAKRMETALRESEEHFRALIENASDVVVVLDREGHIGYASPSLQRVFGYSTEEVLDQNVFPLVHAADLPEVRRRFEGHLRSRGIGTPIEFRLRHRDGSWRVIEAVGTTLPDHPSITGMVLNARDITERRRAEEAQRESEQRALRTAERMRAVADAATGVLGARSLEELNVVLRDTCIRVLPHDALTFATYDPDAHVLRFLSGWDGDVSVEDETVPLEGIPSERVVGERRSVLTLSSDDPAAAGARPVGIRRRSESIIRTPILSGERVLGVLSVQSYTRDLYTPEDVEVLEAFAAVAASAVRNVELLADLERSAAELRESGERYRLATRASHDVIWDLDVQSGEGHWSESLSAVFGYPSDQVPTTGDWWAERIHPEDRERVLSEVRATVMGEAESWRGEYRFRRADGSYASVVDHALIQRSESGELVRMVGSMRDITARRRAEEALRASEERYRLLFEQDLTGNFVLSPDGRILDCNPAFMRTFGYHSPREMVGLDLAALAADRSAGQAFVERLRRDALIQGEEVELRRRDGGPVHLLANAVSRFGPDGDVLEIFGYFYDVTRHKKTEEELRHSQKMEAIGRLAGGVAHDFNNLLTVIKANVEMLLLDLEVEHAMHSDLKEISHAADRAAELTRQLLAFSRRQIFQPERLDLNAVVGQAERMLRRVLGEDIKFQTELDPALGRVWADQGQLEQVLLNLVVNARDAMPDGGRLTIRTANGEMDEPSAHLHPDLEPGTPAVVLSVSDTGTGIEPEIRERIFEPFFTTKEQGKGTGLGLSTVYGIIKQSRGCIRLASEAGRGTTFSIYLPTIQAGPAEPKASRTLIHRLTRGTETILVVEDEEPVRTMASRVLGRAGYSVLMAAGGEEALRIAETHSGPIHLALTDLVMPDLGGRELAPRLLCLHPDMRVLYMSGYSDQAVGCDGTLERGTAFLQKPFDPISLTHKVRQTLDPSN